MSKMNDRDLQKSYEESKRSLKDKYSELKDIQGQLLAKKDKVVDEWKKQDKADALKGLDQGDDPMPEIREKRQKEREPTKSRLEQNIANVNRKLFDIIDKQKELDKAYQSVQKESHTSSYSPSSRRR